jgi:K+ transporter
VCCTTDTRPITETVQKHKENTNIHAETTTPRPIMEQNEATKIQASKTKLMSINIRENYKKKKNQGNKIKLLNEGNTNFEVNTWPFTA